MIFVAFQSRFICGIFGCFTTEWNQNLFSDRHTCSRSGKNLPNFNSGVVQGLALFTAERFSSWLISLTARYDYWEIQLPKNLWRQNVILSILGTKWISAHNSQSTDTQTQRFREVDIRQRCWILEVGKVSNKTIYTKLEQNKWTDRNWNNIIFLLTSNQL